MDCGAPAYGMLNPAGAPPSIPRFDAITAYPLREFRRFVTRRDNVGKHALLTFMPLAKLPRC
ncbi:hypothetical protein BZM27_44470 [Paraburkholderia steynii]|uniref:Uncharacterized protein n=1 Tax=Paraburkholderia steynii TaxID=1245441 RepID=A0A4R0X592_9BURK|nr:hypothetical protein BZM27_44470 [Paraburkholderia steynii]